MNPLISKTIKLLKFHTLPDMNGDVELRSTSFWWFHLCLRVIPVNTGRHQWWLRSWIRRHWEQNQAYPAILPESCFCSFVSSLCTNFAATLLKAKSSRKLEWVAPVVSSISASSRTVLRRSFSTKLCIWSMMASLGLPERELLLTDIRLSFNQWYRSFIDVGHILSSPKASWSFTMR